jgi:hypothetical protein
MELAVIALFALFLIVIPGIAAMPRIISWVQTGGPGGAPAWTMARFWMDVAILIAIVAFLVWLTAFDGLFILEDAHWVWWAAPAAIVTMYVLARAMMPAANQEAETSVAEDDG